MAVPKAAARGAFILFEGVDRCGKTTQSTKLVESLKASGVNAELWRYPTNHACRPAGLDETPVCCGVP